MLFSRSFIILHFTCRSKIHFELMFVKSIRSMSRSTFCMQMSSCPSTVVEKTIFVPLYCFLSFVKDQLPIFMGSISWLSILSHWSIYLFLHQYYSILITVALYLEVRSVSPSALFSSLNIVLAILRMLLLHESLCKITGWDCYWKFTESTNHVEKN